MIKMVTQKYSVPIVAIGGVTLDNISILKQNGIQCFALINSIFSSKDIALTIKKLKLKI
jgi:thiamine-phosphate pyrophosphorylase